MSEGLIISIDGADGSGKATQTGLLVERMNAHCPPVLSLSFPRYETPTGRLVKQYLQGFFGDPTKVDAKFACGLFAADRVAAAEEIRAARASGKHAVLDRYEKANRAHQGSKIKDPDARRAFYEWLDNYEYSVNGIPRTDLDIFLHMPAEFSMALIEKRGNVKDGHETLEHLRDAERTYLEIAATHPSIKLIRCVRDGELRTREDIHQEIWDVVEAALAAKKAGALAAAR